MTPWNSLIWFDLHAMERTREYGQWVAGSILFLMVPNIIPHHRLVDSNTAESRVLANHKRSNLNSGVQIRNKLA